MDSTEFEIAAKQVFRGNHHFHSHDGCLDQDILKVIELAKEWAMDEYFVDLEPDGRECDCEDGHLGGCASMKKTTILVCWLSELDHVLKSYPHMKMVRFGRAKR